MECAAKYSDPLPLYRQENIFARCGYAIPRSTLAQWVGACAVCGCRAAGECTEERHAQACRAEWKGSLVCDDFGGYKAGFANGITEARLPSARPTQVL